MNWTKAEGSQLTTNGILLLFLRIFKIYALISCFTVNLAREKLSYAGTSKFQTFPLYRRKEEYFIPDVGPDTWNAKLSCYRGRWRLSNEKILNKFHLICIRLGIAPWNIHINGYRKFDSVQYRSRYTCQFETSIYFWVFFHIFQETRSK